MKFDLLKFKKIIPLFLLLLPFLLFNFFIPKAKAETCPCDCLGNNILITVDGPCGSSAATDACKKICSDYSSAFTKDSGTKAGLKLQGWTDQLEKAREKTGYGPKDQNSPEVIIGKVIKGVLSFLGVVFLCSIVYGGFLWMTAAGNEERIKKAKQIISNASIGLAIALGAYAITYFVVERLTAGASLT